MAKSNSKKKTNKKANPSGKQTDRDDKGRFAEGNTLGNRFLPGQSGNPNGPPKRKTQLYVWLCKYMELTDDELTRLESKSLTQVQQYAFNLVNNMKKGRGPESERFARHLFDREEGKAVEHVRIGNEDTLSDEDCEEIRQALIENAK